MRRAQLFWHYYDMAFMACHSRDNIVVYHGRGVYIYSTQAILHVHRSTIDLLQ